jgi:hypothetical protein
MTDTTTPAPPGEPPDDDRIREILTLLQVIQGLLNDLLADRDQDPVSDVIKEYLTSMKLLEGHLADTVKILTQLTAQLTEAIRVQEVERSRQNRAMADRMDRLEAKLDKILDLLGEPMSNPDAG